MTSPQYNVLTSDQFKHRIDALNHHLDGMYRAVLHRLVFDDRVTSMIKTITFSAAPEDLRSFLDGLEGSIRREVAELEEAATFAGASSHRFTFGLTLAPSVER